MRRNIFAVVLLVLVIPALVVIQHVQVDNRLEQWHEATGPGAASYAAFTKIFGSDEFVMLTLCGRDFFEAESLAVQLEAVETIEATVGVVRVQAIAAMYRDLFDLEEPEALADELESTPFYREILIAKDGTTSAIVASVDAADDSMSRRIIMASVSEAAGALERAGFDVAVVGSTALIDALDRMSEVESRRAFAVALVCSLLVLALLSRSARAMVVAAVCAGSSVVLTLAVVVLAGHGLNMITSVLPALLWVLGLSGEVHLLRRYRHHRCTDSSQEAIRLALADTGRAMALAAVTTAAGFLSLATAGLPPVRELGLFAACGLLISLVVNLVVGPVLIGWLRVPPARKLTEDSLHGRWLHLGSRRPRTVIMVSLGLMVAAALAVPFIEVASNPLAFLPEDHVTVSDYQKVAESIGGFYTLEIMLDLPTQWTAPAVWPKLDSLAKEIERSEIVVRVVSPLDLLRKLEQLYHGPGPEAYELPVDQDSALSMLEDLDDSGSEALAALVAEDGSTIRLSAIVNEMDEHRLLGLVERCNEVISALPEGFSGAATGQVLRLVEAQQTLVSTQVRSLLVALIVVFVVIAVGLRSFRLTSMSLLPNTLPLLAAFAMMALAGLSLDAATVMVASIALGIAVDDTVHLLVALQEENPGRSRRETIIRALERVGPALVLTTAAACIGFFALMTSAFVPIRAFGLLSGVAMIVALVADLWLVPALLVLRKE